MTFATPVVPDLARFRALVGRELGLRFEDASRQNLERALRRRLAARGESGDAYLTRLDLDPNSEITALTTELTVGETYFLRHVEQFRALTRTALPDLLQSRYRAGPLRLLSAGCSTGEEAYSLAIALRESGIGADASILGVDVNASSLAKARTGRYTDWSLRSIPGGTVARWFSHNDDHFVLNPGIRSAVTFERHNFAHPEPGFWQPAAFDVIFCRNVIMYFRPELMAQVVDRFATSLVPGGYLFLGSAETLRGLSSDFDLRESNGAFYYQRVVDPRPDRTSQAPARVPVPRQAPTEAPEPAPPVGRPAQADLDQVLDLLRLERFGEALVAIDQLTGPVDTDPETLLLRAALLTHSGSLPAAERACRRLLEVDPRSAGAHILLAMCREGANDLPAARDHCRRAITFDPEFAMAHVHLGRLAQRMGDRGTARRQYAASARLLPTETDSRIMLFGGGFDREALISLCRAQGADEERDR